VGIVRENRSEPRIALKSPAVAFWKDPAGNPRTSSGVLKDLSDGGLCIWVKDPVAAGAKLIVRLPLGTYPGTVMRCLEQDGGYLLGIKRDPPVNATDTATGNTTGGGPGSSHR
jgi:hypothetical protein